jgi:NTP pyrophosphatase (non-canonical NTP hydrolase)
VETLDLRPEKKSIITPVSIFDWQTTVHALAREKGWWAPYVARAGAIRELSADQALSKLMLIVSELAEAAEEICKSSFDRREIYFLQDHRRVPYEENNWRTAPDTPRPKPEGFGIELADAFIRLMDTCGAMGVDLELCLRELHEWTVRMFPPDSTAVASIVSIDDWQARVAGRQGAPGSAAWPADLTLSAGQAFARLMRVVMSLGKATEEVRQPNFSPRQMYFFLGDVRLSYDEWPAHFASRPRPQGFGVELADAVFKIMNLCEAAGVDLLYCVREKHEYNRSRSNRHGGKRA